MKSLEELRKLELKKLYAERTSAQEAKFSIAFQVANNESKASHKIKQSSKYLALVNTVITEKEKELAKTA